ncbi:right-handed parallel beta-helix repeat-containing protein [sulfur-oxidizing endosymbiont of Gigantopelta aegis]|uniref:right-handed parallel beta-helix repeat-containing protein n=1 Tax=sulfur-oxidizing endosymbiont of Gigantopelta aegis TaxID=2794934 RepID=UPI001BE44622|nr:right-handed parallel beta-helix repeat-containing protein [sulfur-oxidizing endosymbiont of Gigantopelta aegis]
MPKHSVILSLLLIFFITPVYAIEFWVSKNGNDNNSCTSEQTDACLSIQKAISLARAGDTINITPGTYIENSASSPFVSKCVWMDSTYASLCLETSGTPNNPIIIQAAPGRSGEVILDSQLERIGIHTMTSDYIHIKGLTIKNNYVIGIASWGQVQNTVANIDTLSIGIVIENNKIINTGGPYGMNMSGIGMWGSKDWVVKNNLIDTAYTIDSTRGAAGIQAYGTINALIEHNEIKNVSNGIFWKDHFIKDLATRSPWFESEIRYNKIKADVYGVLIGIRGAKSPEAGENYIHHNIIYGFGNSGAGIRSNMAGAFAVSAPIRIEHNLIDGGDSLSDAISLDANSQVTFLGNILIRSKTDIALIRYSDTKVVKLTSSDYNIFDASFHLAADRYSKGNSKDYSTLSDWQAATSSDALTVAVNQPDQNSIIATHSGLFAQLDDTDYRYKTNSLANNFMPNNDNAGPYQLSNEVIGRIVAAPIETNTINLLQKAAVLQIILNKRRVEKK